MKTTRRGFLTALLAALPAVAALSAAPVAVVAEPLCPACDELFRHPVVLPDMYKQSVTPEMTEMVIALVHQRAKPDILSHSQVAMMIWAEMLPTWQVVPALVVEDQRFNPAYQWHIHEEARKLTSGGALVLNGVTVTTSGTDLSDDEVLWVASQYQIAEQIDATLARSDRLT